MLGLFSSFFESLLGLTMPVVPDEPPQLRRQLEEQAHHVDWLTAATSETVAEGQAQAIEPLDADARAARAAVAKIAVAGAAEPEPAVVEPATTGPEVGPSPPVEVKAETVDSVAMPFVEDTVPGRAQNLHPSHRKDDRRTDYYETKQAR